jgi:hypothetical protein
MPNEIIITDIQKLQRELMKIDPELRKALQRDVKDVAQPVFDRVKSSIPSVAPLERGMGRSRGRLGWNPTTGKKPNDVRIVYRSGAKRNAKMVTSLVSVNVGSAVVSMIDMAGKRHPNGKTRSGASMISHLGRKPSRYVWPAAEEALPAVEGKIKRIIDDYCRRYNVRA